MLARLTVKCYNAVIEIPHQEDSIHEGYTASAF